MLNLIFVALNEFYDIILVCKSKHKYVTHSNNYKHYKIFLKLISKEN